MAADADGHAYVVGSTVASDLPPDGGNLYGPNLGSNVFVTKYNPAGTAPVFTAYVGGSANDHGTGIALDLAGNPHIVGTTSSTDLPWTAGAAQCLYGGGATDAFVAKLSAAGDSLLYLSYLGGGTHSSVPGCPDSGGTDNLGDGADAGAGIAVAADGTFFVTGWTSSGNFPTNNPTNDPLLTFQGNRSGGQSGSSVKDAVVARFDPGRSGAASRVYSTYLGGSGDDWGTGIVVDSAGQASVVGGTASPGLAAPNGYQTSREGPTDAFVATLDPNGTSRVYSSYVGAGGDEEGRGIALDLSGNLVLTGWTSSPTDTQNPSPPPVPRRRTSAGAPRTPSWSV